MIASRLQEEDMLSTTFIMRRWHGRVRHADLPEYLRLMNEIAIPDYRKTPGNLGAFCLHRRENEIAHIEMLSLWRNSEDIAAYAGDDVSVARYYPFDDRFLLEKEPLVEHFETSGECAAIPAR